MATSIFRDNATIASRYLADQLTDAERTAYEAALAEDPEILRELEATARMKVGLARLRSTGGLQSLLRPSGPFQTQFLVALAATVAAIVIGIGLWRSSIQTTRPESLAGTLGALRSQVAYAMPLASTQAVFRKRDDAYDALVTLPAARAAIELRDLTDPVSPSGHLRASLLRIGDSTPDKTVASLAGLRPAADGFVELFVDSSILMPGRYRLFLSSEAWSGDSGNSYLIAVVSGRNTD